MVRIFGDDPVSLEQTRELAGRCSFSLDELSYRYPLERLPKGKTSSQYLEERTFQGAARRLGDKFETQIPQLKKELSLIRELEYEGYFLTMHEIVEYCHRRNILCQGRGSAANSAVCFSLGITGVDPTQVNLLFERFLSRERSDPPDIEIWTHTCRHGIQRSPIPLSFRSPGGRQSAGDPGDLPGSYGQADHSRTLE